MNHSDLGGRGQDGCEGGAQCCRREPVLVVQVEDAEDPAQLVLVAGILPPRQHVCIALKVNGVD